MKLLITGSEGTIGKAIQQDLKSDYELVLLDSKGGRNVKKADICSLDSVLEFFEGVDSVIHLAANINHLPWEVVAPINITGTKNVYRAAVEMGVKRVIYASSTNVYQWDKLLERFKTHGEKITLDTPAIPFNKSGTGDNNDYGETKLLSEELGRIYHLRNNINVVNLRLGSVTADDRPITIDHGRPLLNDEGYAYWLSKKDACRIFRAALNFNGYISIPCTSKNDKTPVDLTIMKDKLGVEPLDNSEVYK